MSSIYLMAGKFVYLRGLITLNELVVDELNSHPNAKPEDFAALDLLRRNLDGILVAFLGLHGMYQTPVFDVYQDEILESLHQRTASDFKIFCQQFCAQALEINRLLTGIKAR